MKKLALFVAVLALVFGGCAKKAEEVKTPATTDTTAITAPATVDTTAVVPVDTTKKDTAVAPAAK